MQWFSIAVVAIMACFAIFGLIDNLFLKNRIGVGKEFTKGFEMIGSLCLSIIGIISLAPLIAWGLQHSLGILYDKMGLDASMAVTAILAMDMGGYQVAMEVASDATIGAWSGIVYGSMMGATVVFSIPVGLGTIQKKDIPHFAKGILFGIAAIPFGTFVGGLMLNIPILTILKNLIIPAALSITIILCLIFLQKGTIAFFKYFSIGINAIAMLGLALAIFKDLILSPIITEAGQDIADVAFFNLLAPASDGVAVAGSVGIVLSGALPFVFCLNKILKKPLASLSRKTGLSDYGVLGILLSSANNMATFAVLEKMNDREKVVNVAWATCGAFIIGDHLAFAAGVMPSAIAPMMVSKLVAGVIAIGLAVFFTRGMKNRQSDDADGVEPIPNAAK